MSILALRALSSYVAGGQQSADVSIGCAPTVVPRVSSLALRGWTKHFRFPSEALFFVFFVFFRYVFQQ